MKQKKVLFIDRDGTLVKEPPVDYQIDSLEKLEFYPGVFQWLSRIVAELDYDLVMVTNQDGLGTPSFPETQFWPSHQKIMTAFKNEGINFKEVCIDRSFFKDKLPTRKPGTAMLNQYIYGAYDLKNSYVIGDRLTDIELAQNLGAKGILISEIEEKNAVLTTTKWRDIYTYLKGRPRCSQFKRQTSETDISIDLNLDGQGQSSISTGLGFFDHMLTQLAKHGNLDINLTAIGDLEVDEHHVIEDVAICLGTAFVKALGEKKAIERYGFLLPMDDVLAQVAIDFGGRPWLVWEGTFNREKIGDMPTEMIKHFFKSFSDAAMANINIKVEGENEHHKAEAVFKAFAKAIKMAVTLTDNFNIPSTKGSL